MLLLLMEENILCRWNEILNTAICRNINMVTKRGDDLLLTPRIWNMRSNKCYTACILYIILYISSVRSTSGSIWNTNKLLSYLPIDCPYLPNVKYISRLYMCIEDIIFVWNIKVRKYLSKITQNKIFILKNDLRMKMHALQHCYNL